ncbi:hypothetical protein DVH24_011840, partial [Malus domestica]
FLYAVRGFPLFFAPPYCAITRWRSSRGSFELRKSVFGSNPDPKIHIGVKNGGGFWVRIDERVLDGFDQYGGSRESDGGSGFPVKSLGNRNSGPLDFRSKSYVKSNEKFNPKLISKRSCSNEVASRSEFN